MIKIVYLISVCILISSCDLICGDNDRQRSGFDLLTDRQTLWQENNIKDYVITYDVTCFCANEVKEVTVTNGTISNVVIKDHNGGILRQIPESEFAEYYTVTDLFNLIEDLNKTVDILKIQFDPTLGYPTTIEVDPHAERCDCTGCSSVVDDEYTYNISISTN